MTEFYGSMQGAYSVVTCSGGKKSGMTAHIRGWNIGVRIELDYDSKRNKDMITIYKTRGSNDPGNEKMIDKFDEDGVRL